ncbi:hypothetical protein QFZ76_005688 [Streptomyces sp. V4I2]|nr:hypothetical protein [Streptomyces sp. V4I2]
MEPPSGFEPETYALRGHERLCCVVPRCAVWCCCACSEHVQQVIPCHLVMHRPKASVHRLSTGGAVTGVGSRTATGLPTKPTPGSAEWTGHLSNLYRRLLTARAGPPSLALPEDGWWISTRGGSRCGARSRGATLVERGRAARVQWSSPGLKHGPPPPRPVQHSSAWPAVRSAVDQAKWGTLPLTRLRQLLPQAPARRPRAAAGARTRRCRGACHCQVHPPRHGSAGRRPYDIRQAAAQQRAREGDVWTTLRSVATTW